MIHYIFGEPICGEQDKVVILGLWCMCLCTCVLVFVHAAIRVSMDHNFYIQEYISE